MSGFFKRWQERKSEVAEHERVEAIEQAQQQADEQVRAAAEAEREARGDAPIELPDPESIEQGGSFADFLKEGVDPATRKQALRALWSQPQYNQLDGLVDYGHDYAAQPLLDGDTAAQLTQSVFRHVKKAADALEKLDDQPEPQQQLAQQSPPALDKPDTKADADDKPSAEQTS
ncbi:DUF3306 domain-containing protein [Ferrimonas senticii]|uniref:DUF3306 domain-containing protein n=1 Tax=Ferrimonas senticii TaxID=394566 RepID=UPI000426968D|nr:DUF3306 domain-containing protein [Ferrimonas senticii]